MSAGWRTVGDGDGRVKRRDGLCGFVIELFIAWNGGVWRTNVRTFVRTWKLGESGRWKGERSKEVASEGQATPGDKSRRLRVDPGTRLKAAWVSEASEGVGYAADGVGCAGGDGGGGCGVGAGGSKTVYYSDAV